MSNIILLVDDEDDILYILKSVLTRAGYEVKTAGSGEECIEMLNGEKPDLIFMDIMMPGINGWETARKIKTDPETKDIPVLMVSVLDDFEDKKKSLNYAMAEDHLGKPVDLQVLLETTESLLSMKN
jgi:CheY-like chemotaxis protein